MMRFLHRSGICALTLAAGTAALNFEPAILRDLALGTGSQRLEIGAVRAPLWSVAFAQAPETLSLQNVSIAVGPVTYEARQIDLSGLSSTRADIEALFAPGSTAPLAERLRRVSARQIAIPELKVTSKSAGETETVTYKNVTFRDVAQGRAASATSDAAGGEITGSDEKLVVSYGRMSVSDLDLPAFASLYETKADHPSAPMIRIHGAFSMENMAIADDAGTVNITVAKADGRDFMARPTRDSWSGTIDILTEIGNKKEPSEGEQARFIAALADLMSAFDVGFIEAKGLEAKTLDKDRKPGPGFRLGRMAYTGKTGSQPADMRVEDIEVGEADNRVRIETISLTGFSFGPALDTLKGFKAETFKELDAGTVRALIPTLGTLHVSGVDIDTLSQGEDGKKPERVKATLKDFELTADKPFNAVPTNIRIGLQNLSIALPPDSKEEGIKNLLDLGYQTLDLSMVLAANWNEGADELQLREVSIQGQDMGSIVLTGLLGSVGKDVFNPDTAIAAVALMGARAKSFDITVENSGLLDRYLSVEAKEQKTSPEALRRTYGTIAAAGVPSLLGNSEQAKSVGQAVAQFIARPGRLTINAQAKTPGGLGVLDLIGISDPAEAFEKLNVTAKAE